MLQNTDERLPLHARLRDALASRIASLEWEAGQTIPSEQVLTREYGVSTNTVRKAVEQLMREGLLERRQGSGTFVRRPSFDGSLFRWFNFKDAASNAGKTVPESRLLKREIMEPDAEVAAALRLPPGAQVLKVLRLRLWAGEPAISEDLFLPLPRFARFADLPEAEIGPLLYPVYEREFGQVVAAVEDELSLGHADATRAALLNVPVGDPIIVVERTSMDANGAPIDWRRAYGRGDRFRYKVRLT
ncbi:GntR family transcriptional regulator [Bosea sp. 2RAB26]|uniref:GntR family transcriptional regulator n=1 Tax=Bosea sp. 2RAB26 TaxID=3237476 RepID=UPI003F9362B0